jgi:hypothetical protein
MPIDNASLMPDRGHASKKASAARKKVLDSAIEQCKKERRPFHRNDPKLLAAIEKAVYEDCWKTEDNNMSHREPNRHAHLLAKGPALQDEFGRRL